MCICSHVCREVFKSYRENSSMLTNETGTQRLIERNFPIGKVNLLSSKEASIWGLPRIHNLHTWFARRPAGAARTLTLAAILPGNLDVTTFERISGISKAYEKGKVIYVTCPGRDDISKLTCGQLGREPRDIVVVDPMAGGGSIPLESLRMGFRTVAVEYNPVAYLILKATLEYPAKYADAGLFEETLKAAKQFIAKAREELGKYFPEEVDRYIFARGIRCPFCKGLIPLQGAAPVLVKEGKKKRSFKRRYVKVTYDKEAKTFHVETTDSETGKALEKVGTKGIKCPYCGKSFKLRGDPQAPFDAWFREHAALMRSVVEEFEPVGSEHEEKLLELHIPFVKQVGNEFLPAWEDPRERQLLAQALGDLSSDILDLQSYIPLDEISQSNRWASTARNKGLTRWYMLFNPRQLLSLARLSKIVAETAEELTRKNGDFGAAVALYLAFALDKHSDYSTLATSWDSSRIKIRDTLRGESTIDFRLEYCERRVDTSLKWALEFGSEESKGSKGGILPSLKFLCDEFRGAGLGERVSVYLGDATSLSSLLGPGSVDLINVDPPYFEQVIYSDKSEFFWVILRRALWPVLEYYFKPGLRLSGWSWTSPTVPREREVVTYSREDKGGRFAQLFGSFVRETYKVLRDDGLLVLWFTHPTDVAWRTVGRSLYEAGYVITRVWPLKTEMRERYKGQVNVAAQETSLIIVARKGSRQRLAEVGADVRRSLLENARFREEVSKAVEDARGVARAAGASSADMMALMLGTALAVATRFEVVGAGFDELFDAAAALAAEAFVAPVVGKALTEGPVALEPGQAARVSSLVSRIMASDAAARSYLALWLLSRVDLESGRARAEILPLSYDFAQTVAKLLGYDLVKLKEKGLLAEVRVRKGKGYVPQLFEALAGGAKVSWSTLSQLAPGRAAYVAYLALRGSGAPSVRAAGIREQLSTWPPERLAEAAALGVVLLETARGADLGVSEAAAGSLDSFLGLSGGGAERQLAVLTLLNLIP
jgi:adenine-specific DNA methylase